MALDLMGTSSLSAMITHIMKVLGKSEVKKTIRYMGFATVMVLLSILPIAAQAVDNPSLITAVESGDIDEVERILNSHDDPNTPKDPSPPSGYYRSSAFETALYNKRWDIVKLLIEKVGYPSEDLSRALHEAPRLGAGTDTIKALLENGANIHALSGWQCAQTTVEWARHSDREDLIPLLIKYGARDSIPPQLNTISYAVLLILLLSIIRFSLKKTDDLHNISDTRSLREYFANLFYRIRKFPQDRLGLILLLTLVWLSLLWLIDLYLLDFLARQSAPESITKHIYYWHPVAIGLLACRIKHTNEIFLVPLVFVFICLLFVPFSGIWHSTCWFMGAGASFYKYLLFIWPITYYCIVFFCYTQNSTKDKSGDKDAHPGTP